MPQFNFSTYSSQMFWLLICFGVFYIYIKFYFLPKLESILTKRNAEITETQKLIEENNKQAEENFKNAEENIKNTQALANKIISDAEAKAQLDEEQALQEVRHAQKQAITEYLAKQKAELSQDVINNAVVESSQIVLKKIGIEATKGELLDIINNKK